MQAAADSIDIEAQALPGALLEFSQQTDLQLAYVATLAKSKVSRGTQGKSKPATALREILAGTGLAHQFVNDRTVAIGPERTSAQRASAGGGGQSVLLAQQPVSAQDNPDPADGDVDGDEDPTREAESPLELGTQAVTGTRLNRAAWETPAQVLVFSAEDLINTGEPTLERALRQLPQNINGVTEFGGAGLYEALDPDGRRLLGTANINGSSTINLRGLGESATLILVNGKRAGESGLLGGFIDISEFPVSMVDRVEIQLDGASAIYGSDAIGGVVNVILKDDYDLTRVSFRRTARTGGGLTEDNGTATYSLSWETGAATLSWDGYRATQQDVGTTSLLGLPVNPWGYPGTVRGRFGTSYTPGEISPALTQAAIEAGALAPGETLNVLQIPAGQDGTNLSPADLFSNANSFRTNDSDRAGEISVTPSSNRHTLRLFANHQFAGGLKVSGGVTHATRRTGSRSGAQLGLLTMLVPLDNPYNPLGVDVWVDVDASEFFEARSADGQRDRVTADLDFSGELGGKWQWEIRSRVSESDETSELINFANKCAFSTLIRLSGCPANPAANNRTDPSQALNVFGDSFLTDGNNAELIAPIDYLVPYERNDTTNRIASSEVIIRRELMRLPAGPIRWVFGAEWRRRSIAVDYTTSASRVVSAGSPLGLEVGTRPIAEKGTQTLRAGFAEVFVPIFGRVNAAPGFRDLNITLSGRHESSDGSGTASPELRSHYSSNVWSAGLVYRPLEAVTLRFNKSTGFRAPDVANSLLAPVETAAFVFDFRGGAFSFIPTSIVKLSGGNPDLRPEQSTSLTSGIEIRPPFLPGLALRANYYDTDFRDRIAVLNPSGAFFLSDLEFSLYGFQYTLDEDGNLVAFDSRTTNIAHLSTRGWDYGADWRFALGGHSFGFSASVAVTDEHLEDINTYDTQAPRELVGLLVPANSYSASLFWERWGWRLTVTAHTRSGVRYSFPSETSLDSPPVETITVMAKTEPALVANFRGSVNISEFWNSAPTLFENLQLSFGINNIGKAYDKVALNPQIYREHPGKVRNGVDARGQLYYLEFSKEF